MEIGVRLPALGSDSTPEKIARVASWAQELGFSSAWVSDHVVLPPTEAVGSAYPYNSDKRWPARPESLWPDPFLALAWAAAAAPSLKLGTSVLVLPMRHPLHVAKQAATLDWLSGGRLLLGVGIGWMREEFELLGAPFEDRGARAVEGVRLMRAMWSGSATSFEGRYWRLEDATMQPCPPGSAIPILWGGSNERTLRRVARLGDGWHPLGLDLQELQSALAVLARLCSETGRDPSSLQVVVSSGPGIPLERPTLERLEGMGVSHLIAGLQSLSGDPARARRDLEATAQLCGL